MKSAYHKHSINGSYYSIWRAVRDLSPQFHTPTLHLNHSPLASSCKLHTSQDSPDHSNLRLGLKGSLIRLCGLGTVITHSTPENGGKAYFKKADLYPKIHYCSQGNTDGLHILKLMLCSRRSNFIRLIPLLATSRDQRAGMVGVRLLILVSEVLVHNVLSKSRGLEFPSNLTSVSSKEKASRKQNYKVYFQLYPFPWPSLLAMVLPFQQIQKIW